MVEKTIQTSKEFKNSQRKANSIEIIGEICIVSVNPMTNKLIQVNPTGRGS